MMIKKIKKYKMTSIRFIISLAFTSILVLAMLFVSLSLKREFNRTLIKSISDSSDEIMEQVKINLDNYFYNMLDLSDLLAVKISGNSEFDPGAFDSVVDPTIKTRRDVMTIALFDELGNQLSSTGENEFHSQERVLEQDWFKKIKEDGQYIFISEPHVQNIYTSNYPWVISISRRVGYKDNGVYKEGILLIDMNFSVIEKLLNKVNLADDGYVFLVDRMGELIYHNQQQLIYSGIKKENLEGINDVYNASFVQSGEEDRYVSVMLLDNMDWKLIGVYNASEISYYQDRIEDYIQWILIIGLFVFVSFSLYISFRITKPISELEQSMKRVEQGDFEVQLDVKGEHEVVQLTKSFNVMIRRIRYLMDQIVIEQEAKRKSELSSLQAQINPHFLYNTLDSIIWMAEHEKHDEVVLMTNALASLFRISLSKGEMIIPVNKELLHAENYLTIQMMRYKGKFNFEFNVEDGIENFEIIKLIIQPIIENAIYHGIRHMVDEGKIVINAYTREDHLIIEVEDDGLGMDENVLNTILTDEKLSVHGVGIRNVHERIQLLYGKSYGLTISSVIEEGTTVTMKLPRNEVKQ